MDLLAVASTFIGWAYVVAWSVSQYPPILLINRLKSVEGVSFDFVFLNLLGYITYTVSQSLLYFSNTVRNEYAQRHSLSKAGELSYPLVRFNDVAYGYHGLAMVLYMLYQMYYCGYTHGSRQHVGVVTKVIFGLGGLGSLIVVWYEQFPPANSQFQMYDVASVMGNVKVLMSVSKYIPQVLWNRRRKSTKGWSIDAIQLDIVGGVLSLGQLFLDGYIRGDMKGVFNNSVKLLLAGITLTFDAIFAFQHYVLYGDVEVLTEHDEKNEKLVRNPICIALRIPHCPVSYTPLDTQILSKSYRRISSNARHSSSTPVHATVTPMSAKQLPPGRFNLLAPSIQRTAGRTQRAGDDLALQRYVLTKPEDVLALPNGNKPPVYPDFYPWTKTSEQDSLAIEYLQKGYYEPPCVGHESGSAYGSMLPLFKQPTSLPALSFFMVRAMEARALKSRITSNSTFKPPPRVTLTDQKREAWLRDLATPSVPLRRLSRTIPHGIRNKSLLDQCCSKNIPIARAAWFARCVGANELRGLKRKGINIASQVSEAAWIQDWTNEVCEYIERLVRDFEKTTKDDSSEIKAAWKSKMEYMTRLSAYLYHEELVDRTLFLKWSIKYLYNCSLPEIPMALVFTKLLWDDLVRTRTLAQSVARTLLHRHEITQKQQRQQQQPAVFTPILDTLGSLIRKLFLVSPDSFVMPKWWSTLGPILASTLANVSADVDKMLATIRLRNESLTIGEAPSRKAARNHHSIVVKYLDDFRVPFDYCTLCKNLSQTSLSSSETLTCLFEWACSVSRCGKERPYIATAVSKHLRDNMDWDISSAFLQFLVNVSDSSKYCMNNLHNLVDQFLTNNLFFLGDYFRRLISMGILFIKRLQPRIECQVQILLNLNLNDSTSDTLKSQRDMLLRGAGLSLTDEDNKLQAAKILLERKLHFLFSGLISAEDMDVDDECEVDLTKPEREILNNLSKGSALTLSHWIVDSLKKAIDDNVTLSFSHFGTIQRCLEELGDLEALYDAVCLLTPKVTSAQSLYFLASTSLYHIQTFAAVGELTDLIERFVLAFNSFKVQVKLSQGFWDLIHMALQELEHKPSIKADLDMLLKSSSNQSPPAELSTLSPISESHYADCGSNGSEIWIQQIGLSAGEVFDPRNLPKYFEIVSTKMIEFCRLANVVELRAQARLMQHLREIDTNIFEELFCSWLRDYVEPTLSYDSESFVRLLLFSVIYDCVTLGRIADLFMQLKDVRLPPPTFNSKLMLSIICGDTEGYGLLACERLILDLHRRQFEELHWKVYLRYLSQDICEFAESGQQIEMAEWLSGARRFLLWQVSSNVEQVSTILVEPSVVKEDARQLNTLRCLFNYLLAVNPVDEVNGEPLGPQKEIHNLMRVFNNLNLPLCQLSIRVLFALYNIDRSAEKDETAIECVTAFAYRAESLGLSKALFGDILALLDRDVKGNILYQTEICFLQSPDFPLVRASMGDDSPPLNILMSLLEIVDAVADSAIKNVYETNAFDILHSLERLIALCDAPKEEGIETKFRDEDLKNAVVFLLKIIIINYQGSFNGPEDVRDKLVSGLCSLRDSQMVVSIPDIHGLLVDILDTIKEGSAVTGQSSAATSVPPAVGHRKTNSLNAKFGNSASPGPLSMADSPGGSKQPVLAGANYNPDFYLRNLMIYDKSTNTYSDISIRAFDLLEGNPTMTTNDVPINLALFDSCVEKSNPN